MRIIHFRKNIETTMRQGIVPKKVVIDGQNYFYNLYEKSGLPYAFGCEADKYADYLRKQLRMFIDAEIECFFIFKGGHENLNDIYNERNTGKAFDITKPYNVVVLPVFMKEVYKEVLRDLGMNYVVCQFESKRQCIALAQTLDCPIISEDIEFCFSTVPYIPQDTLFYDNTNRQIQCRQFIYEEFKSSYGLSDDHIAIFITLTNALSTIPVSTFDSLFRHLNLPYFTILRNECLLKWLSRKTRSNALNKIYSHLNPEEQINFNKEMNRQEAFVCRIETLGIPATYLLNGNHIDINENDNEWFEKGVALGNIAIIYVNLYRSNIMFGSWCIEDIDEDDALLLSFDIFAYAYNLMKNYEGDEIEFVNNNSIRERKSVRSARSIRRKPSVNVETSIFANGWGQVADLRLFEHFLESSLPGISLEAFNAVPANARLLIISLVYFSRRKSDNALKEVYSILLSYVMLGVVSEVLNKDDKLDDDAGINLVNLADCNSAMKNMEEFFILTRMELYRIFDRKLIHAFVEFQHCLQQMNYLNDLCGRSYKPTLYSKTYNGTFVYKFFYSIRQLSIENVMNHIEMLLVHAPSVLRFFKILRDVHRSLL